MNKENMKSNPVLFAIVGFLAGSLTAALYAPKSGKETRQEIKHKADRVQDGFRSVKDHAKETIKRDAREMKEKTRSELAEDEALSRQP